MSDPHAPPPDAWISGPPDAPDSRRTVRGALVAVTIVFIIIAFVVYSLLPPATPGPGPGPSLPVSGGDAVIGGSAPFTWDPARAGDAATAIVLAQIYEGLTAFDAESHVQPALAKSWTVEDGGRRLVFQLRPNLLFSDGTPITAQNVVDSWMRLIDPARPSPLYSLLGDVVGAIDYLRGTGAAADVGLRANGDQVVVTFRRPASYFVAVTASPSLAVLPPGGAAGSAGPDLPSGLVVSGGYRPVEQDDTSITLEANPHYWAGPPSLATIAYVTDTGGQSPVALFESDQLDWVGIGGFDASWIQYDAALGPQLRHADSFSVSYYGFDTTRPPFDDPLVRQAFGKAVDWDRLARLADADLEPATSLIPAGIPGRGDEDFSPVYDPDAARAALAAAGFPGGAGFPVITLTSSGLPYDEAVVGILKEELNVTVQVEIRPFDEYSTLLNEDPPQFWELTWIADYPAPQDFLGLLLETGSSSNEGNWSNAAFDAALEAAAATDDPAAQEAHYSDAQRIVQDQVPVIPVSYGESWSLSRDGLLGAQESGVGFVRFAGLDWADR